MTGIVDYGFYIPRFRIKTEEIANQWGKCGEKVERSLHIMEKAVAGTDEDVLTMAYEAAAPIIAANPSLKKTIGAVFVGSETFPYAVKPTSTMLAEMLDLSNDYLSYDTQFACKAATGALISAYALVKSKEVEHALVSGSDKANAHPGDTLEYSAGSGANAWLLGSKKVLLEICGWHTYTSETPDFWRRSGASYPKHAGRFTGVPAYFTHITQAVKRLMEKINIKESDISRVVFHMPNGTFPLKVGKKLGFTQKHISDSYIVSELGNSYAASALMGLAATLEYAKKDEVILFASYGSGAGSDAIIFRVTAEIDEKRRKFRDMIAQKEYINYGTYARYMGVTS
ncbi:MAG: hydroxymethylglutaryl-CoA synthase [bacterium]|nr:hydroxymethylglutaryl-CoA synthase [bacterium]